jgi:copper chaperone CopZ
MGTVIVLIVILFLVLFAARNSVKHFKGESGCCGGGGGSIAEETKVLEHPVIGSKEVYIEGMTCENCKNRIERMVNRMDGVSCKVNLKKKVAIVSYDREIDEEELRRTIEKLDYKVTKIDF